jgi:exodeoxyribonuclease VII small subunit
MADRTDPTDLTDLPDGAVGYGEALAELEAILDEIEDDAVDVDVLAARVTRAAELLRVCRDRITAARVEVEQIVADLDPGAGTTGAAATDRDDADDDDT